MAAADASEDSAIAKAVIATSAACGLFDKK
jgi:hypothetical protein